MFSSLLFTLCRRKRSLECVCLFVIPIPQPLYPLSCSICCLCLLSLSLYFTLSASRKYPGHHKRKTNKQEIFEKHIIEKVTPWERKTFWKRRLLKRRLEKVTWKFDKTRQTWTDEYTLWHCIVWQDRIVNIEFWKTNTPCNTALCGRTTLLLLKFEKERYPVWQDHIVCNWTL